MPKPDDRITCSICGTEILQFAATLLRVCIRPPRALGTTKNTEQLVCTDCAWSVKDALAGSETRWEPIKGFRSA